MLRERQSLLWATAMTCRIGLAVLIGCPTILAISCASSLADLNVRSVVLSGDQPVGVESSAAFQSFYGAVLNDLGEVAFTAELARGIGGVDYAHARGIWAGSVGHLRLVARSGSQAPGTEDGTFFGNIGTASINDSGNVAFQGSLGLRTQPRIVVPGGESVVATSLNETNDFGIWVESNGSLQLKVQRIGRCVCQWRSCSLPQLSCFHEYGVI